MARWRHGRGASVLGMAAGATVVLWVLTPRVTVAEAGPDAQAYAMMAGGAGAAEVGVFALRPLHPWVVDLLRPMASARGLALLYTFGVLALLGVLARGGRWASALAILPAAASFAVTYPVWNVYVADGLRNLLLVALLVCAARWPLNAAVTVGLTLTHPTAFTGVSGATAAAWLDGRRDVRTLASPWIALIVTAWAASMIVGPAADVVGAYREDLFVAWRSFGWRLPAKCLPAMPALALAVCAVLAGRARARRLWIAVAMLPSVALTLAVTSDVSRALAPLLLVVPALSAGAVAHLVRTRVYVLVVSALVLVVTAARIELPSGSGVALYGVALGAVPVALAWGDRARAAAVSGSGA